MYVRVIIKGNIIQGETPKNVEEGTKVPVPQKYYTQKVLRCLEFTRAMI